MSALPTPRLVQVKPLEVLKYDFLGKRVPQTPRRPEQRQPMTALERAIYTYLDTLPGPQA